MPLGKEHVPVCSGDNRLEVILLPHHRDADCRLAGHLVSVHDNFRPVGQLQKTFRRVLNLLRPPELEQAHKLNAAKLPFNCIVMYGIAGKGRCLEHAEETAALVNQFQSRKIVTMNLTVFNSTPLAAMEREGLFTQASNAERLEELRRLLELLDPPGGALFDSTHATNYVKLLGMLPHEREKLLSQLPEN